jgi:transcriptional regulator with XRE-family HTH domain
MPHTPYLQPVPNVGTLGRARTHKYALTQDALQIVDVVRRLGRAIMTVTAFIEMRPSRPCEPCHTRMRFPGAQAKDGEFEATVHNISEFGLVMESDAPLAAGNPVDVKLPHSGAAGSHVAWVSGRLAGLDFAIPISQISLGAARLQGAVALGPAIAGTARHRESFGVRVQRIRLAKAMTQRQLAELMNVSDAAVCGWELNRTRPKPLRMEELAKVLDISLAELLGHPEQNNLLTQIASARETIANAAGVSEDHVRIQIDH